MQVLNDRNSGKINKTSRVLDHLISFCKFVQVHLGRNKLFIFCFYENIVYNGY